jgi:Domain of unknown function (DUF4412)
MRVVKPFLIGCSLAAALAGPAAAEDVTIVSKVTSGDKPAEMQTTWISSDHFRMRGRDGQEFMTDFATAATTIIDAKKKEYYVITKQEMEAAAAQMQAQMKQVQAQMQNLPPAVKEKMAAAMGGMGDGLAQAVNVQKGTGGRSIAGYACENWIVTFGEMVRDEQCMTTQIPFPTPAYDAMKNMASGFGMADPAGKSMGQMYEKFKEMKGIPLYSSSTTNVLGRKKTTVTEVTEVKKGSIPATIWEIPAGYRKVESPMAKMLQKQK